MKNILSTIAVGSLLTLGFSAAQANPPMQPFYAAVMKLTPEGKLGQVIKKKK
jgi:hypothetical protein